MCQHLLPSLCQYLDFVHQVWHQGISQVLSFEAMSDMHKAVVPGSEVTDMGG